MNLRIVNFCNVYLLFLEIMAVYKIVFFCRFHLWSDTETFL